MRHALLKSLVGGAIPYNRSLSSSAPQAAAAAKKAKNKKRGQPGGDTTVSGSASAVPGFTTVIGLEVHAQLQVPATKLFSRAPGAVAGRGLRPNEAVAFYDAALPGTYPALNAVAVEQAARAGLALGAAVAPLSAFERKHYYYYDLPSGYQVTQQRWPLAAGGFLELDSGRRLRLTRLQLEQDSGKTTKAGASEPAGGRCLVDLNRAGVALVEFVFEPDLRSPEEAGEAVRRCMPSAHPGRRGGARARERKRE